MKFKLLLKQIKIKCDSSIEPTKWNGMATHCKSSASMEVNGQKLCKKHAGYEMVNYYTQIEWDKYNTKK